MERVPFADAIFGQIFFDRNSPGRPDWLLELRFLDCSCNLGGLYTR
jgi:hypothetical protein